MKKVFYTLGLLLVSSLVQAQSVKAVKITDVQKIIAESKSPLIINFWATWCKPCIEELPYFQKQVQDHNKTATATDSIQLILVSLDFKEDYPVGVRMFIDRNKIQVPVYWLDETDADYFCPKIDAKWSGAIPATLFVNNKTGYRNFIEAQLTPGELTSQIMAILKTI